MYKDKLETIVGLLIIAVVLVCGIWLFRATSYDDKYVVYAYFDRADGIRRGSSVRIAGVNVGKVLSVDLDNVRSRARVSCGLQRSVRLPSDSSASICSDGLMGAKFIDITCGASEKDIVDGGVMRYTNSSLNLETLLMRFFFSDKKK